MSLTIDPLLSIDTLKITILLWNLFVKSHLSMILLCWVNHSFCWKKQKRKHVFIIKVNKIFSDGTEFMVYPSKQLSNFWSSKKCWRHLEDISQDVLKTKKLLCWKGLEEYSKTGISVWDISVSKKSK